MPAKTAVVSAHGPHSPDAGERRGPRRGEAPRGLRNHHADAGHGPPRGPAGRCPGLCSPEGRAGLVTIPTPPEWAAGLEEPRARQPLGTKVRPEEPGVRWARGHMTPPPRRLPFSRRHPRVSPSLAATPPQSPFPSPPQSPPPPHPAAWRPETTRETRVLAAAAGVMH